jgi:hypothetical protein
MAADKAITYEVLQTSINALNVEVGALRGLYEENKKQIDNHDKILVRGYDDHLPLAEVVRNLTNTVSSYIGQKDKEEQKKREQWDKLKWIIIPFVITGFMAFMGQAVVFYFRILPMLEAVN